jgi:C4-dicarboxylate-specific signal transduction histidine kinase
LGTGYPNKTKWIPGPVASRVLRYGLALASVAAALGLARTFLHFHLPQTFIAFALSAIAITFWYGGTKPGILAAMLASVVRIYFFEPELNAMSRGVYYLVFLIFALLMIRATRARNELEQRVAERTAELTRANEDLKLEIAQRKRTEAELRDSEAYLAEAQRLTHTASFALNIASRKIVHWSQEHFRLFDFDPEGGVPPLEVVLQRIHPDDRKRVEKIYETATREKMGYEVEYRILLPNGTMKHIHMLAHPVFSASRDLVEYVGTLVDVTERKRADEERERLRQVQADLARISRVTTMGELTASLAHEIKQPIAAAVTDANTCLRWLTRDHPDVEEAREAASRMVKDTTRANDIISRIRLMFNKEASQRELLDINAVIQEMVGLVHNEANRSSISIRTQLAADMPSIMADRVQLQQVFMNLMLNGIEAMKDMNGGGELTIQSRHAEDGQLMVSVSDTGLGLPPQQADQIFNAFFTTKLHGTGMGLSISRSIIESHGGRLWAADNSPRGASFHLTLPTNPF